MSTLHYELNGETKVNSEGITLYRIQYTYGPTKIRGGWVESLTTTEGYPTLDGNSYAYNDTEIYGNSRLINSTISGSTVVSTSEVRDSRIAGDSHVTNALLIHVTAWDAKISSADVINSCLYGGALITKESDVLSVTNIGSQSVLATLHRTDTGYMISVGCWQSNDIYELMPEVRSRRESYWRGTDKEHEVWYQQYTALSNMAQATIQLWESK